MTTVRPVQTFDTSTLNANGRARGPVFPHNAMEQARSTLCAEIAVHLASLVCVARVLPGLRLELGRKWEKPLRREDGGCAERGAGLFLTLGAVAEVHRQWCRCWSREYDAPALTADREGLWFVRGRHVRSHLRSVELFVTLDIYRYTY